MENVVRYRHNIIKVDSIASFMNLKGGCNRHCRDVFFVRALGGNEKLADEVYRMDCELGKRMHAGELLYRRICGLPAPEFRGSEDSVQRNYEMWARSGRRAIQAGIPVTGNGFAEALGAACAKVLGAFEAGRPSANESIKRNFMIKVFCWFDAVMEGLLVRWDERLGIKIVASDIGKEQEYLFFYLLTLIGCDVMLLQTRADICARPELLGLSETFALGAFGEYPLSGQKRDNRTPGVFMPQQDTPDGQTPVKIHLPQRERQRTRETKNMQERRNMQERQNMQERRNLQENDTPKVRIPLRQAAGAPSEKSFEELALLASSVVMVAIHDRKGDVTGTGSGIMVGRDGYILTNNHVAAGGSFYSVRIEDDQNVYQTDEVIKYHSVLDLALLRIDRELKPLPLYQGVRKLVRGQKVVAIGSPLGLFNSVSDGIISGFRTVDGVDMIQFTAPISNGSSGGAVLNMSGEVIGISTAGFDRGQNINLAVGYESLRLFLRGFV